MKFFSFKGTFQQLSRNVGISQAHNVLRNLRLVYVSHLHADHHLGLLTLLLERREIFKAEDEDLPVLYIAAPSRISYFLTSYHREFEPCLAGVRLVKNEQLVHHAPGTGAEDTLGAGKRRPFSPLPKEDKDEMLPHCGLLDLATCRAHHCAGSFCVSLVMADESNFEIVYSGDTRPTAEIVTLGKRRGEEDPTDLLIHEATMGHDLREDAVAKRHSTFTEALEVAKEMGARFTVLTHFSQRYSKVRLPFFKKTMAFLVDD